MATINIIKEWFLSFQNDGERLEYDELGIQYFCGDAITDDSGYVPEDSRVYKDDDFDRLGSPLGSPLLGSPLDSTFPGSHRIEHRFFATPTVSGGNLPTSKKYTQARAGFSQEDNTYVSNGDEVWWYMDVELDSDFTWANGSGVGGNCQLMRIDHSANGSNVVIYVDPSNTNDEIEVIVDPAGGTPTTLTSDDLVVGNEVYGILPKGSIFSLESYVYFSPTSGIVRVWRDGILIYEAENIATIGDGGSPELLHPFDDGVSFSIFHDDPSIYPLQ